MDKLVELKNISKVYTNKNVLRISLTIGQKQIIAILGVNGTGKSTLLRIIAGIARSSSGKIIYPNKEIKIGYVPERFPKDIRFTPSEYLFYMGKMSGTLNDYLTWFVSLVLTFFAFIYPIIFGMFDESVTFTIAMVSIINHVFLSILGICIASLFSKIITENAINSYGGLALTITFSLAALGIYDVLPTNLKNIIWLIPPATSTQKSLINWNGEIV